MKILIIRFSSIGDIVLTSPVVRCLKLQVPEVKIHFLTKYEFKSVVENNPYIDAIHYLKESWSDLLLELQSESFDLIIDLHHNLRTARIKRRLGKKSFSFPKLNIEKWIYTNFKFNLLPNIHIVDRYLQTVHSLGVKNDGMGLDYFTIEENRLQVDDLPFSHIAGYVAVVIGAAHATKRMPVPQLKELCVQIDHPIILLGGKEDKLRGEEIAEADRIKIYNACGKFSLNKSADVVRKSKMVITHDTGLMHIAAAFKKPIVSIWGNTVPAFGMYPYYGEKQVPNMIFEVKELYCRPCSKIGGDKCPKGHFKCMQLQNSAVIAATINRFLTTGEGLS
ncbi:MAG: glycosyltransferase family 9 protein [Bacteroidetes bacterium]|nr:glycosyltransferase family 9 protein [Bacteroidota bacterium]